MQPPPTASRRSLFPTSTEPAPANVSPFPAAGLDPSAAIPSSRLRNPPSPISFAPLSRRPSFDLAAELLHFAADLRAATDGQRRVCVPSFPAFLANALGAVLIQAKALAVSRDAESHGGLGATPSASIPSFSRSMALLACLRHSLPALSEIVEPYLLVRESLLSLPSASSVTPSTPSSQAVAVDINLLEFVLDRSPETLSFISPSSLGSPGRRINLSLSDDTEKFFSKAVHDLSIDRAQVVILAAAYTFSSQHHLLLPAYRDLASDIVDQYSIQAVYAARTARVGLEMIQADIARRAEGRDYRQT